MVKEEAQREVEEVRERGQREVIEAVAEKERRVR